MAVYNTQFNPKLGARKLIGNLYLGLFILCLLVGVVGLATLLIQVLIDGLPSLTLNFLTTKSTSRFPEQSGVLSAAVGTAWIMFWTGLFTVPVGVGAAVYLEEYAPKNKLTNFIEINISNLAGVPSIVYGLLGLAVFVQYMALGRSILAAGLTLSLLVLPIVILASREAIRAVPWSHREAAYGLGATQWEVTRSIVLPAAVPGIATGTILALSRAIGEAAPIVVIAAVVFITFVPATPLDRFTVLPVQIYNWVNRPQPEFQSLAAAGIIVLLVMLLSMNAAAVYIRNRFQKRSEE